MKTVALNNFLTWKVNVTRNSKAFEVSSTSYSDYFYQHCTISHLIRCASAFMSVFTKCYYNDKMGCAHSAHFSRLMYLGGFNQEDVIYFNFYTSLSFSSYDFWCAYSKSIWLLSTAWLKPPLEWHLHTNDHREFIICLSQIHFYSLIV